MRKMRKVKAKNRCDFQACVWYYFIVSEGGHVVSDEAISGALAGIAGAGWMMEDQYSYTLSFSGSPGLGWDGMLIQGLLVLFLAVKFINERFHLFGRHAKRKET